MVLRSIRTHILDWICTFIYRENRIIQLTVIIKIDYFINIYCCAYMLRFSALGFSKCYIFCSTF
jgi:hypothetical protein